MLPYVGFSYMRAEWSLLNNIVPWESGLSICTCLTRGLHTQAEAQAGIPRGQPRRVIGIHIYAGPYFIYISNLNINFCPMGYVRGMVLLQLKKLNEIKIFMYFKCIF